jgi:hypothetical protein
MKIRTIIITSATLLSAARLLHAASVANDNASNYTNGWSNESNGGSGFSAWTINATQGTGFAGAFIGNPSLAGITGMPSSAFGLYANPQGSGASVTVSRGFTGALTAGQTFSFDWGINLDGDNGISGNKGFNLFAGETQVLNVNNGGNSDITVNSTNTGFAYGTNVMTWSFTVVDADTLRVAANDRDGFGTYEADLTIDTAITSFAFYATELGANDARQPYFNNLQVVPEPSTWMVSSLLAVSFALRRRVKP